MFNLGRILRFLGKLFIIVAPFLLLTMILAFATEILTHEGELPGLLFSWQFWLGVALDTLPILAVMAVVVWLSSRFVQSVFQLDSWRQGMGFLLRSRCGLPGFGPWMKIEEGKIAEGGGETLRSIGGPGHLVVYNDSAVVLERMGQLTKVEGAGFPELDPFEKVYDVIDLRPKRYRYTVSAMTKEGIPISWDAEVRYQIADGGQAPTPKSPYPLSKNDVLRAATCKWRREPGFRHGQDMDWEGLVVVSRTEGALRTILARRRLDQLVGLTEEEERSARESLQEELETTLRGAVSQLGAKILQVKLDNLKVKDDISHQWIRAWKARWQSWSASILAHGEASHIYLHETVKAEAQIQLIVNIIRALQRPVTGQVTTPQIVLMRLFSVLDRAAFSGSSRVFFPTEAIKALDNIRRLLDSQDSSSE